MKIIVATDGSKTAERALAVFKSFKWAKGTEVKLLTVLRLEGFSLPFAPKDAERLAPEFLQSAENALKEIAADLEKSLHGCSISIEVLQGHAKTQIADLARKWRANLVVTGSRGIKGVDLMFLGSVSQGVLLQSPCPVLIVKSGESSGKDGRLDFQNLLVAIDDSEYALSAIKWLKEINWADDCCFKLITVVPPFLESVRGLQDATRVESLMVEHNAVIAEAKVLVEREASALAAKFGGERVSWQVGEGDPRDVILQVASSMDADLIVMGSHGRTGLEKLLIGSVSQAVAVQAECSVAVVRGRMSKS